ncbi:histone-lysine N-methyltransferase 2D-like [Dorcoceras hygrometricum]|uniref:Histone-lysine N-methyltransferase 2D-like n=1 Tax=Dorcoceras hygrometricum TaxID=472368 RepID=A0A2Z7AAF2_9LAMI|nr:histone-lysine N-methyltransferase 2D-like [Dorcoceras hygrometricum]
MAASLIHNAIQVYFDSVFSMADEGMVQMFKDLESSGLRGFLGCSSAIYKAALVDFYHNASMRDNKVISSIQGKSVEISEDQFAGIFELPTEVLTDMNEVPKDLVFDARSAFLQDVKIGYFDAVTHERFLMIAAIPGRVKINWGRLLFNLLKDMMTPSSKQARGFAVQIYILLKGAPDLELGESKAFPPLKILSANTVGTYNAKNRSINAEEVLEVPVEKMVKKVATKRRPAPAVVEPAAKKKRTSMGRAAPAEKDLALVPVVQNPEPISVVPAVTPRAQRRHTPKRKLVLQSESDDEIVENIIK